MVLHVELSLTILNVAKVSLRENEKEQNKDVKTHAICLCVCVCIFFVFVISKIYMKTDLIRCKSRGGLHGDGVCPPLRAAGSSIAGWDGGLVLFR